jgi:predicted Na+-dependent transporter
MRLLDPILDRWQRFGDFVERMPWWLEYSSLVVILLVVATAAGHSLETTINNMVSFFLFLGVVNAIRWLTRSRQRSPAGSTPAEHPSPRS